MPGSAAQSSLGFMSIRIRKEINYPAASRNPGRVHHARGNMITITLAIDARHAVNSEFQLALHHDSPLLAMRMWRDVARRLDVEENCLRGCALGYPAADAGESCINLRKRRDASGKHFIHPFINPF